MGGVMPHLRVELTGRFVGNRLQNAHALSDLPTED
jgi:hypothetical protein